MAARALAVLVDGAPMPDDAARGLWERFSAWMEEHRGDLLGFARQEGYASVHPGVEDGRAVLRVSMRDPQRPYVPAGAGGSAGGHAPHGREGEAASRPKAKTNHFRPKRHR
jgi:hypothetical protein